MPRSTAHRFVPASAPRYLQDHPCSPQYYLLSPRASSIFSWERWQDLCMLRLRVPTARSSTRRRGRATTPETSFKCSVGHFQSVAGESSEGPRTGGRRSGSRFKVTKHKPGLLPSLALPPAAHPIHLDMILILIPSLRNVPRCPFRSPSLSGVEDPKTVEAR